MSTIAIPLAELEVAHLIRQLAGAEVGSEPEYIFQHALIQDAAYGSLLLSKRREIHRHIALLLERHFAENIDEYAAFLAHHHALAGESEKAIVYLIRVGTRARDTGALVESLEAFKHALALAREDDLAARAELSVQIGRVQELQGDYEAATQSLRVGIGLARAIDRTATVAQGLTGLAGVLMNQGDYEAAHHDAHEALAVALQTGERSTQALALRMLGVLAGYAGDYSTAERFCQGSLAIYTEQGDQRGINYCLNSLGIFAIDQDDPDLATHYLSQSLALSRAIGDRRAVAIRLMNLGDVAGRRNDLDAASDYLTEALSISQQVGSREDVATTVFNLGDIAAKRGDDEIADRYYRDTLAESLSIGAMPLALMAMVGIAALKARVGQACSSAEILGFALNHSACSAELTKYSAPILDRLGVALPAHELEAALERGKAASLAGVVDSLSPR